MQPYSLLSLGQNTGNNSTSNSSASTLAFLTQPYQLNSSGTLPGATTINVGNNVQISGASGSITIADSATGQTVISILGANGYILYANPSSGVNQMVEGTLPDGTTGMVASVNGYDVLSLFA